VAYINLNDSSNRIIASSNINEKNSSVYRLWMHYHKEYLPIILRYNGGVVTHNWFDGFYFDCSEEISENGNKIILKENIEAVPDDSLLKNHHLINYLIKSFYNQIKEFNADDKSKLRVLTGHGWAEREWLFLYPAMKNVIESNPLTYRNNICYPSITLNHCNTAPNTFLEQYLGLREDSRLSTLITPS